MRGLSPASAHRGAGVRGIDFLKMRVINVASFAGGHAHRRVLYLPVGVYTGIEREQEGSGQQQQEDR